MKSTVKSEAEMIALGQEIAKGLRSGDVLALVGDLGAGKTHFCKGIVAGLGSTDEVTSPTFALVNEYRGGRLPVFHFDFYRLELIEELAQIGWEEYLEEDGVLLVEWADKFPGALPEETEWHRFEIIEGGARIVSNE